MKSDPIVVTEWRKSYLLGLVKLYYQVEDRRPDDEDYSDRFKHYIYVKVFWHQWSWIFRTMSSYSGLPCKSTTKI